jgi:hypothetical protein
MQPILASVPALAVSVIFCLYNAYRQVLRRWEQRQRRLCARVSYLLWVAANQATDGPDDAPAPPAR